MSAVASSQFVPCTAALKHRTRSKRTAGAVKRATTVRATAAAADSPVGYSGECLGRTRTHERQAL